MGGQRGILLPVALDVPIELGQPVVRVASGPGAVNRAAVPEAPIHEDCHLRAREDDVRTDPRGAQVETVVLAEAQPGGVESAPEGDLGFCVAATVPEHRSPGAR